MMYSWFRYRRDEPTPDDLIDDLDLSYDDYMYAIFYWIENCKGEPIPDELKFYGW